MTAPAFVSDDEALGKAYDARLMRRLLRYVAPYRRLVAGALAFLLTDGLLQLVGPLLTQRLIDVAVPARDIAMVRRLTLVFVAALGAQFVCAYGETILTSLLGQRVMRDLRLDLFAQLQRLPIAFFDRNPVGRLVTRVTSDVEALNELFTAGVVAGLGDVFTLAAIAVLMLVVDWRLALAAFAVIPLVVWTSHLFRVHVRSAYRDIRTRLARINAFLQERIGGMAIVQLFGREPSERARFGELNRAHLDAHLRSITVYALYFPAIEFLTALAIGGLLVTGGLRVSAGAVSVGTIAAFLQLVRRFFQPLQDLSDKYNTLQQAMAAAERMFGLLDAPREHAEGRGAADGTDGTDGTNRSRAVPALAAPPLAAALTVVFEDVWFAYEAPHAGRSAVSAPEWVLRGVSFTASPGRTLALVGHTGAGKTTIVNLLLRFYEPQRGRILVNGSDLRTLPIDAVRALVGYVQQDIFLFAGDVASNIRLSSPIDDAAVAAAAARVGADRVIRRLPGGYAHPLGERGATISVGERQLLSFARAVAADPALLILDEATSAVDSELEAEIQRALATLMQGRTTIAIAHRLSTIVHADEILVLHHGQVRERGTHRELLAQRGLYARLYRLQVSGGDEEPVAAAVGSP